MYKLRTEQEESDVETSSGFLQHSLIRNDNSSPEHPAPREALKDSLETGSDKTWQWILEQQTRLFISVSYTHLTLPTKA